MRWRRREWTQAETTPHTGQPGGQVDSTSTRRLEHGSWSPPVRGCLTTPIPARPRALYVTRSPTPDSPRTTKSRYAGLRSIWVNGTWGVTFRFVQNDVERVDHQDYH